MAKSKFQIIFQDEDIIVVNKSSGITVIPTRSGRPLSLKQMLETQLESDIFIVHRIDRETSGIVILAKNEASHKALNHQFLKRIVTKEYICLSKGNTGENWEEIDKPILQDSRSKTVRINHEGKKAISHYKSLANSKRYCKNLVRIETGRMHQIRVHMASVGHPILGDILYNKNPEVYLSSFKKKYTLRKHSSQEESLMKRAALHAYSLEIVHPRTEEKLKFTADLPKDIRACWNQIEKWDM